MNNNQNKNQNSKQNQNNNQNNNQYNNQNNNQNSNQTQQNRNCRLSKSHSEYRCGFYLHTINWYQLFCSKEINVGCTDRLFVDSG